MTASYLPRIKALDDEGLLLLLRAAGTTEGRAFLRWSASGDAWYSVRRGEAYRRLRKLCQTLWDECLRRADQYDASGRASPFLSAQDLADEWVTEMRLSHVLDKLGNPTSHKDIPAVIAAMVEDVCREASGEIVDSKDARRAIGAKAVQLYKARIERVVT